MCDCVLHDTCAAHATRHVLLRLQHRQRLASLEEVFFVAFVSSLQFPPRPVCESRRLVKIEYTPGVPLSSSKTLSLYSPLNFLGPICHEKLATFLPREVWNFFLKNANKQMEWKSGGGGRRFFFTLEIALRCFPRPHTTMGSNLQV